MLLQRSIVLLCLTAFAIPVTCNATHLFRNFICRFLPCKKIDTNGQYDEPGMKYGHHVSIRFDGEHHCSGSIIEDHYILTSYFCIRTYGFYDNGGQKQITVVAGNTHLSKSGGDTYSIPEIITPDDKTDDIALLRTCEKIDFRRGIRKIKIMNYKLLADDSPLTIAAWDYSPSSGSGGSYGLLKEYSQRLYRKDACMTKYSWNKKENMCTYDKTGEGLCHTDAGGGIVANGYLIGIHSNREECFDGGEPKSHTPVSAYMNWIERHASLGRDNYEPPMHDDIHDETDDDAPRSRYPYHVIVRQKDNQHICSGSIINRRHILTSHYCIMRYTADELNVITGVNWLTQYGDSYTIEKVIPSDDYDYDIAILRTTNDIAFNDDVKSIPIIKYSNTLYDYKTIMLIGYERPIIDHITSVKLKHISFQVYNREKCMNVIPFLNQAYMCSITTSPSKRACNMDYGSPIVADGIQVAMNPFGVKCENNDKLHVHLPLSKYSSWIESNTCMRY